MVVGFTTTYAISDYTTKAVSSNLAHSEAYSIKHYVIKFFFRCFSLVSSTNKTEQQDNRNIVESDVKHHYPPFFK